jgi:hypothetical protein
MIPPLASSATFNGDRMGSMTVKNSDKINKTSKTIAISINRSFILPSAKTDKNTPKTVTNIPNNKAAMDIKILLSIVLTSVHPHRNRSQHTSQSIDEE